MLESLHLDDDDEEAQPAGIHPRTRSEAITVNFLINFLNGVALELHPHSVRPSFASVSEQTCFVFGPSPKRQMATGSYRAHVDGYMYNLPSRAGESNNGDPNQVRRLFLYEVKPVAYTRTSSDVQDALLRQVTAELAAWAYTRLEELLGQCQRSNLPVYLPTIVQTQDESWLFIGVCHQDYLLYIRNPDAPVVPADDLIMETSMLQIHFFGRYSLYSREHMLSLVAFVVAQMRSQLAAFR
ncbi:hypothetical protein QBC33DRAFT_551910 [Phialemonium atrogriseum]|uniref:Uncharacterized protein n=1 Tax=Phialemonium atrogriseum TaxID=1093897 RepID=A0AAJ0FCT2_9PEZI|nr:uncharacterized protein QBC33DRAFT_551910 [Phialemonium atrogriseum]KAK1762447.1 hypothetical protein QBC33DRAFT_551910 [Phialemonium atrogriseum]